MMYGSDSWTTNIEQRGQFEWTEIRLRMQLDLWCLSKGQGLLVEVAWTFG